MKVLMTNHELVNYGGTQTWLYEIARVLVSQGHEVTIFCYLRGAFADAMEAHLDVEITQVPPMRTDFDLAIVNHNTCLAALGRLDCRKVYTQHGPSHRLEIASAGADVYVGVSEEVVATLAMAGREMPNLIRNAVDLERFQPAPTGNERPHVLILCKNQFGTSMVAQACERQELTYTSIQWDRNPTWDISDEVKQADIVVSYGRGAVEAMACDKAVIVFDARRQEPRADGFITADNVAHLSQFNFSGRANGQVWSIEDIEAALYAFDPSIHTGFGRARATRHHNVDAAANKYMTFITPDWMSFHDDQLAEINL